MDEIFKRLRVGPFLFEAHAVVGDGETIVEKLFLAPREAFMSTLGSL